MVPTSSSQCQKCSHGASTVAPKLPRKSKIDPKLGDMCPQGRKVIGSPSCDPSSKPLYIYIYIYIYTNIIFCMYLNIYTYIYIYSFICTDTNVRLTEATTPHGRPHWHSFPWAKVQRSEMIRMTSWSMVCGARSWSASEVQIVFFWKGG